MFPCQHLSQSVKTLYHKEIDLSSPHIFWGRNGKLKMKKANYNITCTNGKSYKWTFEECVVNPEDYGNKRYIAYHTPSGDISLIDCRYTEYNFTKICVEFLLNFYGENLDELYEEDETDQTIDYLYKRFVNEEDLHHWSND